VDWDRRRSRSRDCHIYFVLKYQVRHVHELQSVLESIKSVFTFFSAQCGVEVLMINYSTISLSINEILVLMYSLLLYYNNTCIILDSDIDSTTITLFISDTSSITTTLVS